MNAKLKDYLQSNTYINKQDSKTVINNTELQAFIKNIELEENNIFTNFLQIKAKKNIETKDIVGLVNMLKKYEVNDDGNITDLTLANIYIFVKEYKMAKKHIELYKQKKCVTIKLTGKTARAKYFNCIEKDFLALEIDNEDTKKNDKELFETDKLCYTDYYVTSLSLNLQEILLTELECILHTEINEEYRKEKIGTYIDLLKYKKNEKHPLFTRLINYYNTYIDTKEYYHLEQDLHVKNDIDFTHQYNLPVKYIFEIKERLAHVFSKQFRYESAFCIYRELGDIENIIRCYVGLNKEDEAIVETKNRIHESTKRLESIQNTQKNKADKSSNKEQKEDENSKQNNNASKNEYELYYINIEKENNNVISVFDTKYKTYESYLLLASLENKPEYYDMAFSVIQHFEPFRLKGLYYFAKRSFAASAECFYKALEINRTENILFSYGCALIEQKNYELAVASFLELLFFDSKNTKALLNLTNCYFQLKQYENGLDTLLTAIKYTQRKDLVDLYIAMCNKHEYKERLSKLQRAE
ncbi:hypothetical protein BDAP_002771 [Binucleata daphniae]